MGCCWIWRDALLGTWILALTTVEPRGATADDVRDVDRAADADDYGNGKDVIDGMIDKVIAEVVDEVIGDVMGDSQVDDANFR